MDGLFENLAEFSDEYQRNHAEEGIYKYCAFDKADILNDDTPIYTVKQEIILLCKRIQMGLIHERPDIRTQHTRSYRLVMNNKELLSGRYVDQRDRYLALYNRLVEMDFSTQISHASSISEQDICKCYLQALLKDPNPENMTYAATLAEVFGQESLETGLDAMSHDDIEQIKEDVNAIFDASGGSDHSMGSISIV